MSQDLMARIEAKGENMWSETSTNVTTDSLVYAATYHHWTIELEYSKVYLQHLGYTVVRFFSHITQASLCCGRTGELLCHPERK